MSVPPNSGVESCRPGLAAYFEQLPGTMQVARWMGGVLLERLRTVPAPLIPSAYAHAVHDLIRDCRGDIDSASPIFEPPHYATMVGHHPTVYRLEALRAARSAYGDEFADQAFRWFWNQRPAVEARVFHFPGQNSATDAPH